MSNALISVGIDIGTTTSHLVVTKLTFANASLVNAAPNLAITNREIVYESEVFLTPLTAAGEIEAKQTAQLIEGAYQTIGLKKSDIDTGALIITGESARARNAEAVSAQLAELAGDFVVESAGPHLESALAARGSQAVEYSQKTGLTILNIDIGGGTSNYALVAQGTIIETACLNVGGRMLQLDWKAKTISAVSDSAQIVIKGHLPGTQLEAGATIETGLLSQLAQELAKTILLTAAGQTPYAELMLTNALSNPQKEIDEIWLSGGVASVFGEEDFTKFSDLGVFLAQALSTELKKQNITYKIAPRAIRATVIGAGLHTLQLSGSTIGFALENLPLRNLKLIKVDATKSNSLAIEIKRQMQQREHHWQTSPAALVLTGIGGEMLSFTVLKELAIELAKIFLDAGACEPYVLVSEADIAMALNMILKGLLTNKRIITVDGINVTEGDYIDVGKPVSTSSDPNTQSLPIVVKTLLFYKSDK
ncbi:ethanolamine ammonia-lyase reactivating factor EutA [bacterium]|nr:ethanolamine ammonia-lyase reactivating factor EutA [bacterium]MBP9809421.1 ethanolamine ammonia-lyase reactivating factor EutA [bacterium]